MHRPTHECRNEQIAQLLLLLAKDRGINLKVFIWENKEKLGYGYPSDIGIRKDMSPNPEILSIQIQTNAMLH